MTSGTRKLGKLNMRSSNRQFNGNEARGDGGTLTEVSVDDFNATQFEDVRTTTIKMSEEDKTSSGNNMSFNLDVNGIPYNMCPTLIEGPLLPPNLPRIVVGYNTRNMGSYNPRPNPRPDADPNNGRPNYNE